MTQFGFLRLVTARDAPSIGSAERARLRDLAERLKYPLKTLCPWKRKPICAFRPFAPSPCTQGLTGACSCREYKNHFDCGDLPGADLSCSAKAMSVGGRGGCLGGAG